MSEQPPPDEQENPPNISFQINFRVPDDSFGRYATNFVAQAGEHEIFLTFFEAKPPFILKPSEPLPDTINADYVCRIIIAKNKFPELVRILTQMLDRTNEHTNASE